LSAAWDVGEVSLDQFFGLVHIEVSGDAQRRVLWHVERLVEIHEVGVRGRVQVRHGSDGRPLVRVFLVGRLHGLGQQLAVRLVVVTLAFLFFHHLVLRVDANLLNLGVQHALRLEPQPELELVARQKFVVEGAVHGGVGVEDATCIFDVRVKLPTADVLAPLEEQVLEEVGHPCAGGVLVFGTDVVQDGHGHQGGGVVLMQDDVQAVVQIEFSELNLTGFALGRERRRQGQPHCRQQPRRRKSHVGKLSLQDRRIGVSCRHGTKPEQTPRSPA